MDANELIENQLKRLVNEHPDIWRDKRRFKAYLSDVIPEDHLQRNALFVCAELNILDELCAVSDHTDLQLYNMARRINGFIGCELNYAKEIVGVWGRVFGINIAEEGSKHANEKAKYIDISPDRIVQAQIESLVARYRDSEDDENKRQEGILCLQKAVELGYRGDYLDIGKAYYYGYGNVNCDFEKAKYWLDRYINDLGGKYISDEELFDTYYIVGKLYLLELKEHDTDSIEYMRNNEKGYDYWRKAVLLVNQFDTEEIYLQFLVDIGFSFATGKFEVDNETTLLVDTDYKYAFKVFKYLENEECYDFIAKRMLGKMYLEGNYVEQDIEKAEDYYWYVLNNMHSVDTYENEVTEYFTDSYLAPLSLVDSDKYSSHIYDIISKHNGDCYNLGDVCRLSIYDLQKSGKTWDYWKDIFQQAKNIIVADKEHDKIMEYITDLLCKSKTSSKKLTREELTSLINEYKPESSISVDLVVADLMDRGYVFADHKDVYFETVIDSLLEIAKENGQIIDYEIINSAFSEKNDSEISIDKACKLLEEKKIEIMNYY